MPLQTTFSVFLDIFYPQVFGYFEENGLFQHPQALALKNPVAGYPASGVGTLDSD
jgi:hypothetical protein